MTTQALLLLRACCPAGSNTTELQVLLLLPLPLYLSISPNTTSSVPMTVTTSASMKRLHMKSVVCRCAKPGERILHLRKVTQQNVQAM
jgi:hypothetical protein